MLLLIVKKLCNKGTGPKEALKGFNIYYAPTIAKCIAYLYYSTTSQLNKRIAK